jgi:hypothetical protein
VAERSYRPVLAREDYGPSLVEVDMTVIGAHPPYNFLWQLILALSRSGDMLI